MLLLLCLNMQSFLNSHNLNPNGRTLFLGFGWVKSFENFQKNGPYFSSKMKIFHFQKRWKPDDLKSNFRENSSPKCNCSEESFDCSFPFLQKLDFGEQPFRKKKTKIKTKITWILMNNPSFDWRNNHLLHSILFSIVQIDFVFWIMSSKWRCFVQLGDNLIVCSLVQERIRMKNCLLMIVFNWLYLFIFIFTILNE